jgi:hypothetical protein
LPFTAALDSCSLQLLFTAYNAVMLLDIYNLIQHLKIYTSGFNVITLLALCP